MRHIVIQTLPPRAAIRNRQPAPVRRNSITFVTVAVQHPTLSAISWIRSPSLRERFHRGRQGLEHRRDLVLPCERRSTAPSVRNG